MIRRLAALFKSPITRWVVGAIVLVWVLLLWRPTFVEFIELKLYDLKFRFRGTRPPSQEVVILAIDDDSVKKVGRWPWSREDIARLLKAVKEAGPRVIALDIIFAEKQETEGLKAVTNLRQEFVRKGVATPEILKPAGSRRTAGRCGPPTGAGHQRRSSHDPGLLLPRGGRHRRRSVTGEADGLHLRPGRQL